MSLPPLQFEAAQSPMWTAFAEQLATAELGNPVDGALLAARYRRVCEQLALAQSRAYPLHLVARLEALAQRAHPLIYRRQDYGLARFGELLHRDIPRGVRAEGRLVLLALLIFALPLIVALALAWQSPDFALRLLDASQLREYEHMYADPRHLGRMRQAGSDWMMFGFYIYNNVGIGFRTFGTGILAAVGSMFTLVYNGLHIGAVAGHLTRAGLGHNFWPFVVTHSAFELTGIVLSGAAGMRLGLRLLMPGRRRRIDALRVAAGEAMPLVWAAFFLLVAAAVFEAFWSPAAWIAPQVKYAVAGVCWLVVIAWLLGMGRGHAR